MYRVLKRECAVIMLIFHVSHNCMKTWGGEVLIK